MSDKIAIFRVIKIALWALALWFLLDLVNYVWFKPFTPSSFFQRAWVEYVLYHPEAATMTQTKDWLLPSTVNAEISQFDKKFDSINQNRIARFIELLNTYRTKELTGFDKIAAHHLRDFLNQTFTSSSQTNIAIDPMTGDHLGLQQFLVFFHLIANMDEAVDYVKRVKGFASRVYLMENRIRQMQQEEVYLPDFFVQMLAEQLEKLSQEPIHESIIYQDFVSKLMALAWVNPQAQEDVTKDLKFELKNNLQPAFAKAAAAARDFLATQSTSNRTQSVPTQINQERDENKIYDDLMLIYSSIRDQIYQLAKDSFQTSTENIWEKLETVPKDMENQIEKSIIRLKKLSQNMGLEIEMPAIKYHYSDQPFAMRAFSYFGYCSQTLLVNVKKLPPEWKGYLYAEVFPGRHLQHSLTFKNPNLPTFLKFYGNSSFSDAWSFFAMDLVYDSLGSAQEKLSVLKVKLERILVGICDVRIHQGSIQPEQAVTFLCEKLNWSEERARLQVCEILAHPGKRSSFITGYRLFRFWHNFILYDLKLSVAEFVKGTISQGNLHLEPSFNEWMAYRFEGIAIENQ